MLRILAFSFFLLPVALQAQTPAADSVARDTLSGRDTVRLSAVRIMVTRAPADSSLLRAPWAVGAATVREIRRGQPTVALDEALTTIPGVLVANRYNYAVDSRLVIRGFGARANFGVRGLTVLLDGVPQTMPDGQSQLTNIELGAVSRVEVLRGASSALWGNGSGGVVAFTSDMSAPARFQQSLRTEAGSFGLRKTLLRSAGRAGNGVGVLTLSRLTTDGIRQYSSADVRLLNAGVDYALSGATTASLRAYAANTPAASNPGALTAAEWAANPDSASRFNVLRGADKRVTQQQLALTVRRSADAGTGASITLYGVHRDLKNALATPPPGSAAPANGTYVTIGRAVGGARADVSRGFGDVAAGGARALELSAGLDAQRMRDDRRNYRATGGRPTAPTDTLFVHQRETVTSVGPFVQLQWTPAAWLRLGTGGRYDRVTFAVDDRFRGDATDNSSERPMPAWSGHGGATLLLRSWLSAYANVSTSFETPTTTELQARPDGRGGFNGALGPQRARGVEVGARGEAGRAVRWTASTFALRVDDAIVQWLETGGSAYFRNAARTGTRGAELSLDVSLGDRVALTSAYTGTRARYDAYRVQRGDATVVLDGRRVPGVPAHFVRTGIRTRPLHTLTVDVDHTASSAVWADDANTQRVAGWGRGVFGARAAWDGRIGGVSVAPFAGIQNFTDRRYVGAVTINGANGRILEPAPGRVVYVGGELGWRTRQ